MRKVLLAILLSATPAFAQTPALIADLGSPDFRTREAATDKLRAHGGEALQPLQASLAKGSPEANRRAELLLAQIRQRLSDEAAVAPKIVAVKMFNAKLSDVFDELRKQTTYEFRISGDSTLLSKEIAFDTEGKVPLWSAVAKLCEIAGLDVEGASAPLGPINLAPVNVPRPTLSGEEQILKEFREQKLLKLEAQNTVLIGQRAALNESLATAGKNDRAQIQKRLVEIDVELKAIARQIAALKELIAGKHELPSPTGTIMLKARGVGFAKTNPSAFSGAVRIEALPVTNFAPYTVNQLPVRLKFTPEPGTRWVNAGEVIATKATDGEGRELKHDYTPGVSAQPIRHHTGLDIRSSNLERMPPILSHEAFFSLVIPRGGASNKVAMVEGLIHANVWGVQEEILSVRGFATNGGSIEDSNGLSMLSAKLVANPANKLAPYLDVVLSYDVGRVKPRTTGAESHDPPIWLGQGPQGQAVLIKPAGAKPQREMVRNEHGLSLTDADGKPFVLNLNSAETTQWSGLDGLSTRFQGKFRYTFRPVDAKGTGAPAKLAFHGMRIKNIAFPFVLKDVPVTPGSSPVGSLDSIPVPEVIWKK